MVIFSLSLIHVGCMSSVNYLLGRSGRFLLYEFIILVKLEIIFQNGFLELGFFRENLLSNQSFKSWIVS